MSFPPPDEGVETVKKSSWGKTFQVSKPYKHRVAGWGSGVVLYPSTPSLKCLPNSSPSWVLHQLWVSLLMSLSPYNTV